MNDRLYSNDIAYITLTEHEKVCERLRKIIKDLVERIDLNGGIGDYKGGKAFIMQKAREALSNKDSDNGN